MLTSPTLELTETQQRALDKLPPGVAGALSQFVERLVARFGDDIRRVILYGSFARGEAHEESDVDVMVVVGWEFERLPGGGYRSPYGDPRWEAVIDLATDATLECDRYVSAFVADEALFQVGRDAIREARREGIELYHHPLLRAFVREEPRPPRVLKETDSGALYVVGPEDREDIERWLSQAEKELDVARYLYEGNYYSDLFSNLYYAMLYAAKAALLCAGVSVRSHEGAISEFGRVFAASGRAPGEYGKMFSRRFEERLGSDYTHDFHRDRGQAEQAVREAEAFLIKARELVKEELNRRGGAPR